MKVARILHHWNVLPKTNLRTSVGRVWFGGGAYGCPHSKDRAHACLEECRDFAYSASTDVDGLWIGKVVHSICRVVYFNYTAKYKGKYLKTMSKSSILNVPHPKVKLTSGIGHTTVSNVTLFEGEVTALKFIKNIIINSTKVLCQSAINANCRQLFGPRQCSAALG